MVVLASCSQPIGLRSKILLLRWTRFFEWNRLKVTSGYGLGIMPSNLEGAVTHFLNVLLSSERDYGS